MTLLAPHKSKNLRLFVPEVVQTSQMDCGPATLKAMLEGFGIAVSYGRLREACQTNVDGTSINTVEIVARQLGLKAQQVMLPADFLLLDEANALPAIAVVRLPTGTPHFVVVWNSIGPFIQVMNPAAGRQWIRPQRLLGDLYLHTRPIPANTWRDWARTDAFTKPLARCIEELGVSTAACKSLLTNAQQKQDWLYLATLDAATRLANSLARANAIDRGVEATKFIEQMTGTVYANPRAALEQIPSPYWSVTPTQDHADQLVMRGAVIVAVAGIRTQDSPTATDERRPAESTESINPTIRSAETDPSPRNASLRQSDQQGAEQLAGLPPELANALTADTVHPFWEIWKLLRQDGLLAPAIIAIATVLAALGVMIEALLLRGILQASEQMVGIEQRTNVLFFVLLFGVLMFLVEFVLADSLARMGRHLDMRLRVAFLAKLPRLGDRYFQSRLISDMTMRAHDLAAVKKFPELAVQLLRLVLQLLLTTLGVIYFVPNMAGVVLFAMALALLPSLLARPLLQEQDLRYRTHTAGLSRFYLDGLLGLIPLRTHSAEQSFQNAHELLLTEWFQAGRNLYTANLWVRGIQALLSTGSVILLLLSYLQQGGETGNVLLLLYWTLNLPVLGQSIANVILQYPQLRNRVLRVLEPLGTPDENAAPSDNPLALHPKPATITMQTVNVVAGGQTILHNLQTTIDAGEHVAIVGASGAGKSSLVGLLLGWHKPARGLLLVDGQPLEGDQLEALRRQTVWVDPAVHLWNRSLLENLAYGNGGDLPVSDALDDADLYDILQQLPNGLQTALGEGGGLVSGGQGQRVRLGRGLLRNDVRLVILDEPFRGLDRSQRRALLAKVRRYWQHATLLCISHDVGDTQGFDRVLVIDKGQIIEDGSPTELATAATSRYKELLDAEEMVRRDLWEGPGWRRLWLADGVLTERAVEQ